MCNQTLVLSAVKENMYILQLQTNDHVEASNNHIQTINRIT